MAELEADDATPVMPKPPAASAYADTAAPSLKRPYTLDSGRAHADAVSILHTGGAAGADACFASCAARAGHAVAVHTFHGHKPTIPPVVNLHVELRTMSLAQAQHADRLLAEAGRSLGRPPTSSQSPFIQQLLRRNAQQALEANTVYAMSDFLQTPPPQSSRWSPARGGVGIQGGTAWCSQVFVDILRKKGRVSGAIPLYFFAQTLACWWQAHLKGSPIPSIEWVRVQEVPRPAGAYAGVGARKLLPLGAQAIEALFK